MAADSIMSRELRSLQEELSATRMTRAAIRIAQPEPPPSLSNEPIQENPDLRELRDQFHELANGVAEFFDGAEKYIAAHPAQSVIGALLVGILIGRLLPR